MSKPPDSLPFFEKIARELVDKLSDDPSPDAGDIVLDARRILNLLQSYVDNDTPEKKKADTLQELLTVNRRALEYLTKKDPPLAL